MWCIALVLTAVSPDNLLYFRTLEITVDVMQIENILDEWVTGAHVSIDFSEKLYKEKYLDHLHLLQDFSLAVPDAADALRATLWRSAT